ncbi:tubulin-tyrosine ligase [Lojkania enalia]|uniref:Tubulin-tyrosine ligase n=1 Tax=Lojkania enalia TaxID=147567 RepID=A0A9P4KJ94_9PLEO|nr:tubulin-tyrosine ligase [Didymosphaeria enalia]
MTDGSGKAPPNLDIKIYALVNYEDPYVQPLILAALEKKLPPSSYQLIESSKLSSTTSQFLQFLQYESIDFDHVMQHRATSLCNAYIIRKALIRKHYLSTTVSNWIVKNPESVLKRHVKPAVEFEVDYAEFLDDALVEAFELKESWERNEGKDEKDKEHWILKPGMSERGQGIRLFSSEEELTGIFEEWDPESDDEGEEDDVCSNNEEKEGGVGGNDKGNGIITSQLRHFIAQPYIHPPLLMNLEEGALPRKFHIRTYVLAVGALKVYVYRPMLALFAAKPYLPPWESANSDDALRAHLTNTCLQDTNEREGSVSLFWSLPADLANSNASNRTLYGPNWKETVFEQICNITGEVFEAAARSMNIHFQPLPNAFELFGLDFLIGVDHGSLTTYLLEVNAFPDFRQTGDELKGLVEGLFEGVVDIGIRPFFGLDEGEGRGMVNVLHIDLGRR